MAKSADITTVINYRRKWYPIEIPSEYRYILAIVQIGLVLLSKNLICLC